MNKRETGIRQTARPESRGRSFLNDEIGQRQARHTAAHAYNTMYRCAVRRGARFIVIVMEIAMCCFDECPNWTIFAERLAAHRRPAS